VFVPSFRIRRPLPPGATLRIAATHVGCRSGHLVSMKSVLVLFRKQYVVNLEHLRCTNVPAFLWQALGIGTADVRSWVESSSCFVAARLPAARHVYSAVDFG